MSTDDLPGQSPIKPANLSDPTSNASPKSANEEPYVFKHGPKITGDSWEILLKPEMDADTARCDAWKDEVQNLLIFAGLFSAVVTAFVIESYKSLQPDPSDAVVGLLFHIANSLNGSSAFPPSVDPASINSPFSKTSSSVRINIFWFLSLILSLTTVLIGTIALQWLREHQAYTGSSAKEKIAILHMRSVALDVWRVPQIFAALPVLLQVALALFLAGLIDFVLPLDRKLTISVSVIIGLTLLFLVATTALPTCQYFFFFTGFYPYRQPPSPCAYKSPQSRVVLAIFGPVIRLMGLFLSRIMYLICSVYKYRGHSRPHWPRLRRFNLLPYLGQALKQNSWSASDRQWLDLRDRYHQCIYDRDPRLYLHQYMWKEEFPLSDLCQVLVKTAKETHSTKHSCEFIGAAIHCFEDLVRSIWTNLPTEQHGLQRKDRRSNYFEQLLSYPSSLAKWTIHCGHYKLESPFGSIQESIIGPAVQLFQWDQTLFFVELLLQNHDSYDLAQFQVELWSQIISHSYIKSGKPGKDSPISGPHLLSSDLYRAISTVEKYSIDQAYICVVDMLEALFQGVSAHKISTDQDLQGLCTCSQMQAAISGLEIWTEIYCRPNTELFNQRKRFPEIDKRFITIFGFVVKQLEYEARMYSDTNAPSALFYLSTAFILILVRNQQYVAREFNWYAADPLIKGLRSLLAAILKYRTSMSGQNNDVLETRYRLSDSDWNTLFKFGYKIGLQIENNHAKNHVPESPQPGTERYENSSIAKPNSAFSADIRDSSPSHDSKYAADSHTGQHSVSSSHPRPLHVDCNDTNDDISLLCAPSVSRARAIDENHIPYHNSHSCPSRLSVTYPDSDNSRNPNGSHTTRTPEQQCISSSSSRTGHAPLPQDFDANIDDFQDPTRVNDRYVAVEARIIEGASSGHGNIMERAKSYTAIDIDQPSDTENDGADGAR